MKVLKGNLKINPVDKEMIEMWVDEKDKTYLAGVFHIDMLSEEATTTIKELTEISFEMTSDDISFEEEEN